MSSAEAIWKISGDTDTSLWVAVEMLADKESNVRCDAAELLGNLAPPGQPDIAGLQRLPADAVKSGCPGKPAHFVDRRSAARRRRVGEVPGRLRTILVSRSETRGWRGDDSTERGRTDLCPNGPNHWHF